MARAALGSASLPGELQEAVQKYEDFVRERLEPDLARAVEQRDAVYKRMSEYLKLKTHIDAVRSQGLGELETKVDLGSNFYVKAFVPDTTHIFVSVGFGFHLQMTLDEADAFIDRKVKHMETLTEKYTDEVNHVRAQITMVYDALSKAITGGVTDR